MFQHKSERMHIFALTRPVNARELALRFVKMQAFK